MGVNDSRIARWAETTCSTTAVAINPASRTHEPAQRSPSTAPWYGDDTTALSDTRTSTARTKVVES